MSFTASRREETYGFRIPYISQGASFAATNAALRMPQNSRKNDAELCMEWSSDVFAWPLKSATASPVQILKSRPCARQANKDQTLVEVIC